MKTIHKSNFRIVVEPRRLGDLGGVSVPDHFGGRSPEQITKEYLDRCEDIIRDIKRHCDDVRFCTVEYDKEEICSHCGYSWEESPDDSDPECPKGMPLCCEKAIKEWEQEKLQASKP